MNRSLIVFFTVIAPSVSLAASTGGHGDGIPSSVIYQAINFLLFVGVLVYFLRRPVREYFRGREEAFKQALFRAEAAKREAEHKRQQIQERLTKLENTTDQSVAQARSEAEALKKKIIDEAQQMTITLREEAHRTAQLEIERAKNHLREEMLSQAIALSRKMLEEKIAEPDQKRLQTEFVDKIQVVR